MDHLTPIWNSNRIRWWNNAAAMFTDEPTPGPKLPRPPQDKTSGPWVVATLTGFITIGTGRPKAANHHDTRANVYDRIRHTYAIYGKPGPLHLARHWHSRQAAWRCGRKVDGLPVRLATRANVDTPQAQPHTTQKPRTHSSTKPLNASPRERQGALFCP